MLPESLLIFLDDQIPRRQLQIRQIASLLDSSFPSPSILVLHGLEATGKSFTIKNVLEALGTRHAIIQSQECITTRHLLERTLIACTHAVERPEDALRLEVLDTKCENVSALVVQLQQLLEGKEKFVLVLDGIDRQREAPPTLLPALARMGEVIPNLIVVMVVTAPRPRFLHLAGVPHIHFVPYDRTDSIAIVSQTPFAIFDHSSQHNDAADDSVQQDLPPETNEDDVWLWSRFCGAVWDSLGKGAARDIVSFRRTCEKIWEPFVKPIRDSILGTRDFSKLMVRNRVLFQGEATLIETVVSANCSDSKKGSRRSYQFPYYTNFLLIAAYLASYNPSRQDQVYFMKASEKKRRKKGGGTSTGRPAKHRKIQRKLLGPQAFIQERLLAIFHAILPDRMISGTADIMIQIATLATLRLLVKMSGPADVLDAGTKWKVNVGWDFVKTIAKCVRFDIESYLAE